MDVDETIAALDRGEIRVAEKVGDDWQVNEDAKTAILAVTTFLTILGIWFFRKTEATFADDI